MSSIGILKSAAVAVCLCILADSASAQFHVRSTTPDDGATGVPLETVIRFDFSEAVNTANDFARNFVVEPRDKVSISQVALLVRDLSQPAGPNNPPAIVEFTVEHEPNTDYTWLVYAVHDADGEFLDTPHTLRYTTASDIGSLSVSGTVFEATPTKRGELSIATKQHLRAIYDLVRDRTAFNEHGRNGDARTEHVRDWYGPTDHGRGAATAWGAGGRLSEEARSHERALLKRGSLDDLGPHTQVLLLSDFEIRSERQEILAAGVIRGETGPYEIDHVRPGTYWPIAVRYTDATHQTIEALGFYDADGDHTPSSITVEEDTEGVDLLILPFAPSTARERLNAARAAVDELGFDPAPRLQLIESQFGGRTDGTAYGWSYRFYSGYSDTLITVSADPFGVEVTQELATSTAQRIVEPLGTDFLDSDTALQLALDRGGSDVIARYPPENITVSMFGGNRHWLFPQYEPTQFWDIHILASSMSGVETFDIRLDMETGETIVVGVEDELPHPRHVQLGPIYPNPVNAAATVPIVLERSEAVSLAVFDMLGRRVAVVVDSVLPAGRHELTWAPSHLAAGTYAIVLIAGNTSESRTIVVAP